MYIYIHTYTQGAQLTLSESVIDRSKRMGLSVLGADTKATINKCTITDNGEYGIIQAQVCIYVYVCICVCLCV